MTILFINIEKHLHLKQHWGLMAMDKYQLFSSSFGRLSDKINTPLGKRTPFILVGTTVALITGILVDRRPERKLNSVLYLLGIVLLAMDLSVSGVAQCRFNTKTIAE